MKICVLIISFICLFSCSNSERIPETRVNSVQTVSANETTKNSVEVNLAVHTNETPIVDRNKLKNVGSFRVDFYEDNELFSSYFYHNELCVKYITYNTETKKQESEVEYFYEKSGKLKQTKVIQGDDSRDARLESDKSNQDFKFQRDFLQSKGVDFPLADIVNDEISDLSNVFSVSDNYQDFKTETKTDGNQKVIKFIGFNKTSRFHNSPIALLIGNGDFINIKDYELTLENSFPLKEIYRTPDGGLTKTYSYKNGKLTGVVYQFTDLQNQTNFLKKRFEYQELK